MSDYDDELTRPLEGAVPRRRRRGRDEPAVGRDEWVARHGERRGSRGGRARDARAAARGRALVGVADAVRRGRLRCCPVVFESGYVRRVAFDTVVFMLLALGLNIVVGWGGLLDLGYVAFFGVGAYAYALLSSDQYDIHLPTLVVDPARRPSSAAIVGLLVGLPSRRLTGDYLAIVTLFFFQVFLTVTNNGDDVFGHNVTGRAERDPQRRPVRASSAATCRVSTRRASSTSPTSTSRSPSSSSSTSRCASLNDSRTGRAWRSLREDPLAAEVMGMPVNWLKLMAFAFGAGGRRADRDVRDGAERERLPAELRVPAADHDLHDGHPRRRRQPGGRRARRRDRDQRPARGAARPRRLARPLLRRRSSLGLVAVFRFSRKLAVVLGGTLVFGVVAARRGRRDRRRWIDGRGERAAGGSPSWAATG